MKIVTQISIIVASLVLAVMPAKAANLLVNGDFNTGDFTGWWTYSADVGQSNVIDTTYTLDASPNAALGSGSATWREVIGQDPAIGGNVLYNLSFDYSATDTPTWGSAAVAINYYDASANYLDFEWILLYDQQPAPNANGEWLHYSGILDTAPNTAYMDVQFNVWNWTVFHFDNASIEVVPEPTSGVLFGLASLGLLVFRRRK